MGHNWLGLLQPQDTSKPVQPGGCSQCHPGSGNKPNPIDKLTQADLDSVDCLLCHATNYKRTVVKEGDTLKIAAAPGVDVLAAARSAQRPISQNCLVCHAGTGGGPNAKHGVIPTMETDVHMAKGLVCVDCHTTTDHKVAGGADLKVQEMPGVKVACGNCHTEAPHKGTNAAALNQHTDNIACQTCHIPAIARDPKLPTVVNRDWTKPVLNAPTGLYGPTNQMAGNVAPEYHWWNRTMKSPPEPVGSRDDGKSLITPWKRADYTVMADAQSGTPIYMKAGVYSVTGNVDAAVKKGAEDAKQEYSGAWKPLTETMVFSVNHQVAPAGQAVSCQECHTNEGRLDFVALGYNTDEVVRLTSMFAQQPAATPAPPAAAQPTTLPKSGGAPLFAATAIAGMVLAMAGFVATRRRSN